MFFSLDDILSALNILIAILLVIYLFGIKSERKISNYLFGFYYLIHIFDASAGFAAHYLYPVYPNFAFFIITFLLLQPPLLYFYVRSVIYNDFKFRMKDLLHFLPFVILNLVFLDSYYLVSIEEKLKLLDEGHQLRNWQVPFDYILLHLSIFSYLIASFRLVFRYKKVLKENYSNPEILNQKWLFWLLIVIASIALLGMYKNIAVFWQFETKNSLYTFTNFSALICICLILLKIMRSPNLFMRINSKLPLAKNISKTEHITNHTFDHTEINQIKQFMDKEVPYLDASLTVHDLASKLNMSTRDLSILLNKHLNQNFFDFVNEYRINKAKEILLDPSKSELTILEILYEVGFNSKSSFNTAFKKYTHYTPTEYRKTHLKSVA